MSAALGAVGALMAAVVATIVLQDVLGSHYLGFHAFVKTAVAYLVGGLGAKFILHQPFPQFLSLLLATVLDAVLATLLAAMVDLPVPFGPGEVAQRAVLNSLVGLALFRLAGRREPEARTVWGGAVNR